MGALTALQRSLLEHAVELVRPGGLLVYCTCSLEPEECEAIVDALLARDLRLRRRAVAPEEVGGLNELLTAAGDIRTLPCHLPDPTPQLGGMDGFYAARLEVGGSRK
jgi:16S rRNA (cytosine967-C5)-methyltransferase